MLRVTRLHGLRGSFLPVKHANKLQLLTQLRHFSQEAPKGTVASPTAPGTDTAAAAGAAVAAKDTFELPKASPAKKPLSKRILKWLLLLLGLPLATLLLAGTLGPLLFQKVAHYIASNIKLTPRDEEELEALIEPGTRFESDREQS